MRPIKRGNPRNLQISVFTRDADGNKVPTDITGWTFRMQVKLKENSPSPVFPEKTGTVNNGPLGLATIPISATDSMVPAYIYLADIKATDADGVPQNTMTFNIPIVDAQTT